MLDILRFARDLVADLLRPHVRLVAENAVLRQQWVVAERKVVGRVDGSIRAVRVLGGLHHDYRRAA